MKKISKKIFSYTVIYQAVKEGGYVSFVPSLHRAVELKARL